MALVAARLNAEVILVVTECSDRYVISLFPHLHTPFSTPSLISLMVSVDVKHHAAYLHNIHGSLSLSD